MNLRCETFTSCYIWSVIVFDGFFFWKAVITSFSLNLAHFYKSLTRSTNKRPMCEITQSTRKKIHFRRRWFNTSWEASWAEKQANVVHFVCWRWTNIFGAIQVVIFWIAFQTINGSPTWNANFDWLAFNQLWINCGSAAILLMLLMLATLKQNVVVQTCSSSLPV